MTKKTNRTKKQWRNFLPMAFFMLIGAISGYLMVSFLDRMFAAGDLPSGSFVLPVLLFLAMYAAIFGQTILHEAGHLVFGLLSGYQFSSFRILSLMWIREDGRIRFRRFSVAGTGGQCLMSPPDPVGGRIPVVLYNLGGSLMNLAAALVFFALHLLLADVPLLSAVMLLFAVAGVLIAVMNGIPMRMGTVDNDGYNAFALTRNADAVRSFWIQLKATEQIARGVRPKDMPDEWFAVPSDAAMQNSMVAVLGVLACNRLMDAQKFDEADRLMAHMLEIDSGMIGLHRSQLLLDRLYVELVTENRPEALDAMRTKALQKLLKAANGSLSAFRTQYAYALLHDRDAARTEKAMKRFERYAKAYPYPGDLEAERELMDLAREKAA